MHQYDPAGHARLLSEPRVDDVDRPQHCVQRDTKPLRTDLTARRPLDPAVSRPSMNAPLRVLLLPGLFDSGPEHWQSHWERADPSFVRVVQQNWESPARGDWVATLEAAVASSGPAVVLVAHSAACALVAFWAGATTRRVRGALLVAPADTEAPSWPAGPTGWQPMPLGRLPFPSLLAASSDDEFVNLDRARAFAEAWGSRFVHIGAAGHINATSGLGPWSRGKELLADLLGRPGVSDRRDR
jgi:predicted alpha/beta hydrolase family esterase